MAWTTPLYSRQEVTAAGKCYLNPGATPEEREIALAIINNWRSSHGFPLNTFQMTLRGRAQRIDPDATIAQRTKRLSSIEAKLRQLKGYRLPQIQDIGGCRAVLSDIGEVQTLRDVYLDYKRDPHTLISMDDYIAEPPRSGYRGIHLVYGYGGKKQDFHKLRIEIQLRSRHQHAWATAVETVGTFTSQSLKSSKGSPEWLRFFSLMGTEIAHIEKASPVPGTPARRKEVRDELRDCVARLDVINRLQGYRRALRLISQMGESFTAFFLLELDSLESTLTVHSYKPRDQQRATTEYEAIERATRDDPHRDVVLVSADSTTAVKRAYPNYFADTRMFMSLVQRALR